MNLQNIQNRYGLLSPKKKKTVIGLSAGIVATFSAAAWIVFAQDRHEELAKWDENYHRLCYTSDEEEINLKSRMAMLRLNEIEENLSASHPFGTIASNEFNQYQEDRVYCFGEGYDGKDISNWWLTGVTIIDENYPNNFFASNIVMDDINNFWKNNIDNIEERLRANDALFYSRFQRALYAVYIVDQIYQIDVFASNSEVFNSKKWQELEGHSFFGNIAKTYKQEILNNSEDHNTVLRNSLYSFLIDGDVLNEGDLKFMGGYYPYLEDYYEQCMSYDQDGFCSFSIDVPTDPPSYVHSRSISPEIIIGLSDALYGGEGFLSADDALSMISDDRINTLHSNDADYNWSRVFGRINEYKTQRHYQGQDINPDRLYDLRAFESLYSKANTLSR